MKNGMKWLVVALAASVAGSAFAGDFKASGKVYADFSFRHNADDGTGAVSKDSGTMFDLKRFYVTLDYSFNDMFGARFRSDIGDQSGHYDLFVKNAYLEAKFAPELILRAGVADLPWVPWVEDRYGFRYVENVLIDRTHFGTSADWGLHLLGDYHKGLVNYQLSVVNGRGYGDPTRSQSPTVEARLGVAPIPGLNVAVSGEVGKLGQQVVGVPAPNTAQRFDALASYQQSIFRVGVNGFYAKDYAKAIILGKAPEDSALGVSAWAAVQVVPKVSVFGRFDWVQPTKDTDSDVKDTYFNAGVEVKPWKPLNVALVFKHDQVNSGASGLKLNTTDAGNLGSSVPQSTGTFNEVGIYSQFVF